MAVGQAVGSRRFDTARLRQLLLGRQTPEHIESSYIEAADDLQVVEQLDRLRVALKYIIGALLLVLGVTSLSLLLATFRDAAVAPVLWFVPLLALIFLVVALVVDQRLTNRPPGTVEVPGDMTELLLGLQDLATEARRDAALVLSPEEFTEAMAAIDGRVRDAIRYAAVALTAQINGDQIRTAMARTQVRAAAEDVIAATDALDTATDDEEEDEADFGEGDDAAAPEEDPDSDESDDDDFDDDGEFAHLDDTALDELIKQLEAEREAPEPVISEGQQTILADAHPIVLAQLSGVLRPRNPEPDRASLHTVAAGWSAPPAEAAPEAAAPEPPPPPVDLRPIRVGTVRGRATVPAASIARPARPATASVEPAPRPVDDAAPAPSWGVPPAE